MSIHAHRTGAPQTAGLLLSLANALPDPSGPLARRAGRLATRLSHGTSTRADHDRAADCLARLLDATDAGLACEDPDCLDLEWDA